MNGAAGPQRRPAAPAAPKSPGTALVARLRELHLEMVDAVLHGEGLERVAQIAARAADAPVAIIVPRLGAAAVSAGGEEPLEELRRYVGDRIRDRPVERAGRRGGGSPDHERRRPGRRGAAPRRRRTAGSRGARVPAPRRRRLPHRGRASPRRAKRSRRTCAARSSTTCARVPTSTPPTSCAAPPGSACDLSRGVVALCAELTSDRPRHVVATIAGDYPGALAQHLEGGGGSPRVHALLPATGGDSAPEDTLTRARALADRLGRHGTVGLSSFYTDPADIGRAIQEAELVLEVLRRNDGTAGEGLRDIGTGTYRLLFRVLASHPEEVRSFYEDTIAPVVRYDDQYRTDLIGTLEAYFEQNCNMNATAAAIYAHRHTVAYRLDRVRELSGLDATQSEDRERLGLGLKAYRIISPRLPR